VLTASFFAASILLQFPLGAALDRYGPRRVNAVLFLFAAAGALVFSFAQSYEMLVFGRTLVGLGVAAALVSAMQAFVLWYPRERTGTLISSLYAMGGLGILLTSFPLAWALQAFAWREIFLALTAASLAVSALLAFWVPERTAERRPHTLAAQFDGIVGVFRDPGYRRAALALAANQFAVIPLLNLWMATWLRDLAGFDERAVAWMLALVALAMIAGYLVSGRAADALVRSGRSEFPALAAAIAGTLIALAPLALGIAAGAIVLWPLLVFFGMDSHSCGAPPWAPLRPMQG
jgi:predicted MFS family arabinose efflux permease